MERCVFIGSVVRSVISVITLTLLCAAQAFAQGLIRDSEIETYLRDFTDPILDAANLQSQDVGIYIIGDDTLNAFVANGQRIHLNTGLIMASETPGQLIGVIAHETGHIEGGHSVRRLEDMKNAARPAYISIGLGILAIAAGAGDAGAALIASSQQFAYLNFASHTRTQEANADQAALRYLKASGQSPRGLLEFFENFREDDIRYNAERYKYFYTHPLAKERIRALRTGAEESGLMNVPESAENVDKLKRMQAKLTGFLGDFNDVNAKYPESDTSVYARYARAIVYFRNSFKTLALKEVESLIAEEPENPYFHELLGQIYYESGDVSQAIAPIRKSLEYAPKEPLLMVNLAVALQARNGEGDLNEAGDLLTVATAREPTNGYAWYELARIRAKQGRTGEALLANAEQNFNYKNWRQALDFAYRAEKDLQPGTPAYVRVTDIIKASMAYLQGERNR